MEQTYNSFQCLVEKLSRCNDCCNGDFMSYHCPLCPVSKYKPRKRGKVEKHLHVHWNTRIKGNNDNYTVVCHLQHEVMVQSRHFHCPVCGKVINKKENMVKHAQKCTNENLTSESEQNEKNLDHSYSRLSNENEVVQTEVSHIRKSRNKIACKKCGKMVNKHYLSSHLKTHRKKGVDIDQNRHHHTILVDSSRGIYCSAINLSGAPFPVHCIKKTSGNIQENFCEHQQCIDLKSTANLGGNQSFECPHLRSIQYARRGQNIDLNSESLGRLKDGNFIKETRHDELLALQADATAAECPFVVRITQKENVSSRYIFLSIYTGNQRHWSKVGRAIVSYDSVQNTFSCKCSSAKRYCTHKAIGKWFLYQEMPHFFTSESIMEDNFNTTELHTEHDDNDLTSVTEDISFTNTKLEVFAMLDYNEEFKKIPVEIPQDRFLPRITELCASKIIMPEEIECHKCFGSLSAEKIANRAKMIFLNKIIKDVTVYVKICPRCRTIYRYQEWSEGIHNFNNVLFLGLDVCLFLRAGLKNHNAMGRSLAMLEDMLSEKLNHTETEKAYLHFEAMTDHKYRFNCVICGYHPSILIWDTFRKAAFRFAVSDMKTPQSDEVNEEVNIKDFWGNLEKCLILRGVSIDESKRIEISPNYSNWSPWIGENSRKGDLIYNTEYKKCGKACHDEMDEPMPEELIINLLIDEKVTSIRRICRELRIGCDGSAMDMILRLREHSITTSSFDKAYEKVFGRSGGWAVGCCRHGIVYAIKNLLRSESPRDYIDLERSLKHRPNVSISDIAHLLASHGNKTTLDFFYPNAGRLDTVTEDNIRNVEDGNTTYSLPYLTEPINHASGSGINFNPTTGCSDHLSLYDWFHQYNCKKRDETLRRCSIVREIAGIVDTQAVEQLFSSSKRDIYFLNNLSPSNHLFLFRLIYHLRNEKANAIIIAKQKKHFGTNLKFNSLGQVCANYLTEEDNDNEDITEEDNDNEYINEEDNNNDYIHEEDNNNEAIYEAYIVEEEISGQDVGDAISEIYQNQQENVEIEDFEQLKYQSTEYQFLQDIVNTILKDKNKLTREEFQHLQSNVKYCNSVLFAKAEVQRQNLVHVRGSQYGTFQYQGTSNYCGLCCVNNALGIRNEGPIVSINQMDKTADQLWLSMVANPSYGLTIPLEPMRDREGFYSVQVIERVLQDQGFDMLLLNLDETLKALEPSEIAANVWTLLYSQFGMAVLIVRPSNSQHWITIRLEEGVILFLDPSVTAPRIITMEFLGSYIIKNMSTTDGQTGSVYFLSPVNGEDLISNAAVGCTVQDGSEASMNVEDGYPPQNQSRQQFKKPCQKTYDLRENPAQKRRKSYIYEIPKKHRRNEIDPEINRGNGDVNDFKDWEKECSDETEKECSDEVEKECSDELEKECSDESISGNGEEPNGCDKMSALYCSENYGRTLKKLKQVFLCDDSNCTIFLHKRHHGFVRKSSTTYNRERLTHCYGSAVFEKEESCEKLHKSLQDDILYVTHDRQRPYSAWSSQIRGIKDTALQEIFSKSSTLTYAYLYSVACKTAIMIMYTDFKGCTYEETDAICRKTEMHVTEESKKMKNLVRI